MDEDDRVGPLPLRGAGAEAPALLGGEVAAPVVPDEQVGRPGARRSARVRGRIDPLDPQPCDERGGDEEDEPGGEHPGDRPTRPSPTATPVRLHRLPASGCGERRGRSWRRGLERDHASAVDLLVSWLVTTTLDRDWTRCVVRSGAHATSVRQGMGASKLLPCLRGHSEDPTGFWERRPLGARVRYSPGEEIESGVRCP